MRTRDVLPVAVVVGVTMVLVVRSFPDTSGSGGCHGTRVRRGTWLLLHAFRYPLIQVVPLAVSPNEGRRDEVCLLGNNKITLWGGVDLPLSDQHVESVPQDLHTWSGDAYGIESETEDNQVPMPQIKYLDINNIRVTVISQS